MDKRTVVQGLEDFRRVELAGRYKSTAGSQPAVDAAVVDAAMASIESQGFVVFERLLPPETVEAIRADVTPRLPREARGRNNFEGFATQRIYGLLEQSFVCDPLVEHPLILALLDRVLEPNYLLSQLQVINILPGEARQPLHYDDAFYPWPRPRPPLGAATIWAIDEFTETNGATVVLPGSHRWGPEAPGAEHEAGLRSVVMPAGSVIFFVGTLWHAGGANRSAAPRMCASAQYCAPWCRQQENFSLSVSRARARASSEHLQRMLGYSIHKPFMGFVNGMHPRRLLESSDAGDAGK
jgi:ectoine hydroxylase-related dioxygenase (phytanoyl-CoA dioxygenase family)